ncbi:uncharacterized protein LOC132278860 [Cornus florida]|uniref:uncharacterized protein LOC132278860 n=1 Tax=Cornus florida TaxID=4283 RepID=UPI00289B5989|nr:uncharacterized protein LOC132278860 [Cornus florida]
MTFGAHPEKSPEVAKIIGKFVESCRDCRKLAGSCRNRRKSRRKLQKSSENSPEVAENAGKFAGSCRDRLLQRSSFDFGRFCRFCSWQLERETADMGLGPEAAVLELPSACADVDLVGTDRFPLGGGEEAEIGALRLEEGDQRWRFGDGEDWGLVVVKRGLELEEGGVAEEKTRCESPGEPGRGHRIFSGIFREMSGKVREFL